MRRTTRLILEPLRIDHAAIMVDALSDPELYKFTGGESPTVDELTARYEVQVRGESPDGTEQWRNWVVRIAETSKAIGYVQATIRREHRTADLAWVIGARWWGRGYATEAASSAMGLLRNEGVAHFTAHISPGHVASERVAWKVGLRPTTRIVDGEVVWAMGEISGP